MAKIIIAVSNILRNKCSECGASLSTTARKNNKHFTGLCRHCSSSKNASYARKVMQKIKKGSLPRTGRNYREF